MSERDFVADMLDKIGISKKRERRPPFEEHRIEQMRQGHPQQPQYDVQQPMSYEPRSNPPPQFGPRNLTNGATQYSSVHGGQLGFNVPGFKGEYENRLYKVYDSVDSRTKKKPSQYERYDGISPQTKTDLDNLDGEIRKIDNEIGSKLWNLSEAFNVRTSEGQTNIFDAVDRLYTYVNTADFYKTMEYVKLIIPKFMEVITIHVKSFEDYEAKSQFEERKAEIYMDWFNHQLDRIVELEEENKRLSSELKWENRFKGAKEVIERSLKIHGLEDSDYGLIGGGLATGDVDVVEGGFDKLRKSKFQKLNSQIRGVTEGNYEVHGEEEEEEVEEEEVDIDLSEEGEG